jgi:DNA-binding transcriptional regulator YhcF (GntR family)
VNPSPIDKAADPIRSLVDEISVDRKAEVPIGTQLAWALRSRIGDGRLAPGDRLPGLRELAEATGVNVNTVRSVYQRLEAQGLIDSQQGSGTFVRPRATRPAAANKIAASAANEAREVGVDPREVAAVLYASREAQAAEVDPELERRRLLRAQIGALERTVSEMEALHPGLAPAPEQRRSRGPALLGAEELEQVRAELVRRLAAVQAAIDARAAGEDDGPRPQRRERDAPAKAASRAAKRPSNGAAKRPSNGAPNTRPATA